MSGNSPAVGSAAFAARYSTPSPSRSSRRRACSTIAADSSIPTARAAPARRNRRAYNPLPHPRSSTFRPATSPTAFRKLYASTCSRNGISSMLLSYAATAVSNWESTIISSRSGVDVHGPSRRTPGSARVRCSSCAAPSYRRDAARYEPAGRQKRERVELCCDGEEPPVPKPNRPDPDT